MVKKLIYIFFISMLPIVELRGAIPYGVAIGVPYVTTYIIAVIGNILPVPFLIIFAKKILEWLSKSPKVAKWHIGRFYIQHFFINIIKKADKEAYKIGKYELWGLFIFVAIPLPGTGAWTGSLIAATLRLRLIPSFIVILLGVLSSGVIMTGASWLWKLAIGIFI